MADACPPSADSVSNIDNCPMTSLEWNQRASKKNCSSYPQTCIRPLEYHCMLNPYGNESLEVCAPNTWLVEEHCPSYSTKFQRISDQFNCSTVTEDCPRKQYFSNTILKYKGCLEKHDRYAVPDLNSSSIPKYETLAIVLPVLAVLMVLVGIFIYYFKKIHVTITITDGIEKKASSITQGESDRMIEDDWKEVCQTNSSEIYFEPKRYKGVVDMLQKKRTVILLGNIGSGKTAMANYIARSSFSDYKIIKMVSKAEEPPEIHGDKSLILWDDCFGLWRMTKEIDPPMLENLRRVIQLTKDNSTEILAIICVDTFYVTDDLHKDWSENYFLFNLDNIYQAQIDKERFIECYKEYIRLGRVSQDVGFPLLIDLIHVGFCPRADYLQFLEDPFTYICNDIDRLRRDDCDGYVTLIYAVCQSPTVNLKNINEEHWSKLKGECCSKKIESHKTEHGYITELESDEKLKQRGEKEPLDPNNDNYQANKQDVAVECETKSSRNLEEGNSRILKFPRRMKKKFTRSEYVLEKVNKTVARYLIETKENFIFRFRHHYLAECVLKFHVKHFGKDIMLNTATTEI